MQYFGYAPRTSNFDIYLTWIKNFT
jgi:hypothetical protein